jgi:transmembrane sensor
MKSPSDAAPEIARLEQAGEWVQRLHASPDPLLIEQWIGWCERDPQNLDAFERLQETWHGFPEGLSLAELRPQPHRTERRRNVLIGLAASLVALFGAAAWIGYDYPKTRTLSTAAAEQRHERLSDGSQIDLAPNSRLSVRFSPWRREIRLEGGQVYFAVAQEKLRPFVVHANGLTAVSSGTAFDVRTARDGTVVTVSAGRVNVRLVGSEESLAAGIAAPPISLRAGQRATLSSADRQLNVSIVDPTVAEAWRSGMLAFVDERLGAVVNEVDRFVNRRIVIASALQDTRYTGTVSPVNVADWLEALKQIYSVQVIDEGADEIHIQARGAHGMQNRG